MRYGIGYRIPLQCKGIRKETWLERKAATQIIPHQVLLDRRLEWGNNIN